MKEIFAQATAIADPIRYHRLLPYNDATRAAIDALKSATHLDAQRLQALLAHDDAMYPLHDAAPFSDEEEDGQRGVYQWADLQNPHPSTMVQISITVDTDGKPDSSSLLMVHGASFQGALVYEKKSGPSVVLIGFPELQSTVRDNIEGVMACCKDIWEGRVFEAEEQDIDDMLHILQDATGGCSHHAQNRRKGPFVAMPA